MTTVIERLKAAITVLRSRLAAERETYLAWHKKFTHMGSAYWPEVSAAIKIIAFYYHGEIVRAKHDTADYILGHEVHGTYGDSNAVEEIHEAIASLYDNIVALESDGSAMDERRDYAELITNIANALEEVTYAEK